MEGADFGLAVVVFGPAGGPRIAERGMAAFGVGHDCGFIAGNEQTECREIGVKERGVIGILQVLLIELPVRRHRVAVYAENF
jgi:hypothetical protein